MSQKSDSYVFHRAAFSAETTHLFVSALRYYADMLERDIKAIRDDERLTAVLDERTMRSFRIAPEIDDLRRYADGFEEKLRHAHEWGDYEMPISLGLVRKLKAICTLYLSELQRRRDEITATHQFTTLGLEALDTKLAQWREKLSLPIFKEIDAPPLHVSELAASIKISNTASGTLSTDPSGPAAGFMPAPRVATTIEIMDQQLRERCLDLFNVFDSSNQTHRFDTVVNEATRVLEDRIRRLAGLGNETSGVDLMTKAFGHKAPILRLSTQDSEQEAAHLLFRGAFGFIRNPAHHRLIDQLEKERVLQVLGLIDYLLYLAETATKV